MKKLIQFLTREKTMTQIFNTSANGMWVLDKEFKIILVNDTLAKVLQIDKHEVIGKRCYEVFSGLSCRKPECPLTRIVAGEKLITEEMEKNLKNGRKGSFIVTATPHFNVKDKLIGIVEDFKDITKRKQAEQELRGK